MPTPLNQRMLTSASAYAPLTALLGTSPFRWYDDLLQQGSAFPAIVVTQVSGNITYAIPVRLKTGYSRWQFTIWGGRFSGGDQARESVGAALVSFFDQWSGGINISGLTQYSNRNVLTRNMLYAQTDPPVYLKIMDFVIFSDDQL